MTNKSINRFKLNKLQISIKSLQNNYGIALILPEQFG